MLFADPAKRNALLLAMCQALYMSGTSLMISTSPLVGHLLASDKTLATLPIAFHHVGIMCATLPASFIMQRLGRRNGFLIGATIGFLGALTAIYAVFAADFVLFTFAILMAGFANGFAVFYRFAAADTAGEAFRAKAISWVMAGGLFAAFIGPEVAKATVGLFSPVLYAGAYAGLACFYAVTAVVVSQVRIPRPVVDRAAPAGRSLGEILRQPACVVALLSGIFGYATMSLVMTSTPLAMYGCGFGFTDSATVIQLHIFAMFAPSFFTGSLIRRYGATNIIAVGVLVNLACVALNLAGVAFFNFAIALALLGVGWNFMFIGATTLLTTVHSPAERAKVQGLNDFAMFATTATAAFSSGGLLNLLGWETVNLAVVPLLAIVAVALIWLHLQRRIAAPA
ncbi:putative MFS family arabinose efflux permease [Constrictibacter sp. MBR-5]|uniref:MFS transporter n=1 Tax=Constrictibacter sp. MBR-5 TaxID=3156467 RepID=UPI00339A7004